MIRRYFLVNNPSDTMAKCLSYKEYYNTKIKEIEDYAQTNFNTTHVLISPSSLGNTHSLVGIKGDFNTVEGSKPNKYCPDYFEPSHKTKIGRELAKQFKALTFDSQHKLLQDIDCLIHYTNLSNGNFRRSSIGEIGEHWVLAYPCDEKDTFDPGPDFTEIKKWEYEKLLEENPCDGTH